MLADFAFICALVDRTAECYATGSGVPRDFALAVEYLRGAVRQCHRGAALRLAAFLERGNDNDNVDENGDNDRDRDLDCSDSGSRNAVNVNGAFGDGRWGGLALARDLPAAHALHALGAEWGCEHAMFALAFEYQHGVGTEANAELAAQWYEWRATIFSSLRPPPMHEWAILCQGAQASGIGNHGFSHILSWACTFGLNTCVFL